MGGRGRRGAKPPQPRPNPSRHVCPSLFYLKKKPAGPQGPRYGRSSANSCHILARGGLGVSFSLKTKPLSNNPKIKSQITDGTIYTLLAKGSNQSKSSAAIKIIPERITPSHLISPNANLIVAAAVPNGSTVAYGSGFMPNENFIIAVVLSNSNTKILGGGAANNSGAFTLESIVDLSPGIYTALATGGEGSSASAPLLVSLDK